MKKSQYQPLKDNPSKEVELDSFLSSQHGLIDNDSKNDRMQSSPSENDDLEYSYRLQSSSASTVAHNSSTTTTTTTNSLTTLSVMYEKLERRYYQLIFFVILLSILFILYTVFFFLSNYSSENSLETSSSSSLSTSFHAKSIAFGSCSSYDLRDLSIWDDAILPIKPDAWIWTGDFVYLDETARSCSVFEPSEDWQRSCNCSASWLAQPSSGCHAGDVEYASDRWGKALRSG